jgi:predicted nucleic acid-binding protein
MAWLLDTNVLSELRRPKPEPKVVAFVAAQPLDQLYISVVTLAEIRFGIELVAEPGRRVILAEWLTHTVRPMFDRRILPITEEIMEVAAADRGGPKDWTHLFPAGPHHRRDGPPLRPYRRDPRSK